MGYKNTLFAIKRFIQNHKLDVSSSAPVRSLRMLCLNFLSIDRHRACLGWTLFMALLELLPVTS